MRSQCSGTPLRTAAPFTATRRLPCGVHGRTSPRKRYEGEREGERGRVFEEAEGDAQ
jgi:hypothetical protein